MAVATFTPSNSSGTRNLNPKREGKIPSTSRQLLVDSVAPEVEVEVEVKKKKGKLKCSGASPSAPPPPDSYDDVKVNAVVRECSPEGGETTATAEATSSPSVRKRPETVEDAIAPLPEKDRRVVRELVTAYEAGTMKITEVFNHMFAKGLRGNVDADVLYILQNGSK
jgi:hypothetical protein